VSATDPLVEAIVAGVVARIAAIRPPERTPRLMDIDAAAHYLSRTPKAVRALISKGILPTVRLDDRVMLDVHDLDQVIEQAKGRALS
jgi:hypothetical protein